MTAKQHAIVVRAWSHIREAVCELERLPADALKGTLAVRLNSELIPETTAQLRQIADDVSFLVSDGVLELQRCKKASKKAKVAA